MVEGEAGPLMLSPSGQFITPAGIPPSLLVGFISDNMGEARERLNRLGAALDEEKQLVERCIREVNSCQYLFLVFLTLSICIKM